MEAETCLLPSDVKSGIQYEDNGLLKLFWKQLTSSRARYWDLFSFAVWTANNLRSVSPKKVVKC